MNIVVAIYATLAFGYLVGGLLHKFIQSTSYILFVSLVAIWSLCFVISYDFLTIGKFRVLLTPGHVDNYLVLAANFITTFVLGVSLSLLVVSRAKYLTKVRWLKVVIWLPLFNLATLMFGMRRKMVPHWKLNKWNVTTIATALLALSFIRPGIGEAKFQEEAQFHRKQQAEFSRVVAEEVSRNQPFPYAYDVDGVLLLNGLSSKSGVITLELSESEPNLLLWGSMPLNHWLDKMLCDQWGIFNVRPSQPYDIDVSFIVSDFAGSTKWQGTARRQICSPS